jgi:hypothetical protein
LAKIIVSLGTIPTAIGKQYFFYIVVYKAGSEQRTETTIRLRTAIRFDPVVKFATSESYNMQNGIVDYYSEHNSEQYARQQNKKLHLVGQEVAEAKLTVDRNTTMLLLKGSTYT